ncbi:MAG: acyl-CoA dehydrogenase C-terminal domain-containing protein, partial [Aquabacterium sp.]|nr:acyl-CoA dehydrogenase C-terminal domain-containing protein [Aquabacterium sp.]
GWQMARSLIAAEDNLAAGNDVPFMEAKIVTARFYGDHILARVASLRDTVLDGGESVTALSLDAF